MDACTHTRTHTRTHTHTHEHQNTHMHTHTHAHTRTHRTCCPAPTMWYTHICTQTHTRTHTRTCTRTGHAAQPQPCGRPRVFAVFGQACCLPRSMAGAHCTGPRGGAPHTAHVRVTGECLPLPFSRLLQLMLADYTVHIAHRHYCQWCYNKNVALS